MLRKAFTQKIGGAVLMMVRLVNNSDKRCANIRQFANATLDGFGFDIYFNNKGRVVGGGLSAGPQAGANLTKIFTTLHRVHCE